MNERPNCKRCGGPLDFWQEPDDGRWYWFCNNLAGKHTPVRNDEEHWKRWNELTEEERRELNG